LKIVQIAKIVLVFYKNVVNLNKTFDANVLLIWMLTIFTIILYSCALPYTTCMVFIYDVYKYKYNFAYSNWKSIDIWPFAHTFF